jgi:ribosome modulation factor
MWRQNTGYAEDGPHWTLIDPLSGAGEGIPSPPANDLVGAFQQGREAALRCRSHELCPYLGTVTPDLFQAWMGGYWSGCN